MFADDRKEFHGLVNIRIDYGSQIIGSITTKEIFDTLRENKNGNAAGSRDIPIELIKNNPPCIIRYLQQMTPLS